tara:strand:- start:582 stop:2339 length:1758 start_codon:yes stop_codon:yes gene_type:complete
VIRNYSNDPNEYARFSQEKKTFFLIMVVFYFFFVLLTPLGNDIEFLPHSMEATGIYHLLHFDEGDDAGYYAYLRSLFFDGDIDFFNEPYYAHNRTVLDTGYVVNSWKIGPAILWFPFYLLSHGITWMYNFLGEPLSRNGLSFVYIASTAMASATYSCLGLILNYLILRRWFSRSAAFLTIFLFFLGTGLVYFTFIRSRMAHANDYFLVCLFVFIWLWFRDRPTFLKGISMGLAGGLMLLNRINSAGYFLLPLYDLVISLILAYRSSGKIIKLLWLPYVPVFVLCFLVYSLQLNVNRILGGSMAPIPTNGEQAAQLFSLDNWKGIFSNSNQVLFGGNWGLLWHAPVYFLGAVGLYFFIKRLKDFGFPLLLCLTPPVILFLVWPHHGLSYGARHLLTVNLIFSVGLAELYDRKSFRLKSFLWVGGSIVIILWSYFQMGFFKIVVPHDSNHFVWQAYQSLELYRFPRLWLRGENLVYVISQPDFKLGTSLDWYLIVVHPLLQGAVLLILLFTGVFIWARIECRSEFRLRFLNLVYLITIFFFVFLHFFIQTRNGEMSQDTIARRKAIAVGKVFPFEKENRLTIASPKP